MVVSVPRNQIIPAADGFSRTRLTAMPQMLTAEQVSEALGGLEGWSGDTEAITRTAELPSFPAAIAAVDKVAVVAEELNHHPDIDIRWRKVTFTCTTHSAGGVTDKDLELAGRINEILAAEPK